MFGKLRWQWLIVVLLLVAVACSGRQAGNSVEAPKPEQSPGESVSPPQQTNITEAGQFPIAREKVTLKIMVPANARVTDFATNEFTAFYEEMTNVHIEWDVVPANAVAERLNLVLASGDLPDIIMGFPMSTQLLQIYGSQNVFVPLNEYIDQYGVQIKQIFADLPFVKEALTAPDGNIYALPKIEECYHCSMSQKLWIYQPWLDKLGLRMPTTTDELLEVLRAFKTADPNGNGEADEIPIMGGLNGAEIDRFLMNSFVFNDRKNQRLMIADGKVEPAYDKPEWKQGLLFLKQLYDEGLLYPQSFIQTPAQMVQLGENPDVPIVGAAVGIHSGIFTTLNSTSGRWAEYRTVPPLQGPGGLRVTPYDPQGAMDYGRFVVTRASKHPDIAYRWADALYEEELTIRANLGRLGEEYRWANPGEIGIDGKQGRYVRLTVFGSEQNIMWAASGPHMFLNSFLRSKVIEDRTNNLEILLYEETEKNYEPFKQDPANTLPRLWFTEQMSSELTELSKPINDYVEEMLVRFVTGDADIENDWNAYLNTLQDMNLGRYLQIYQEAYDASQ